MKTSIQAVKFTATEKLQNFITKKVEKLGKFYEEITSAEVILTVVKPETQNNKEVSIKLIAPQSDLFASKTADSFEEATDLCIDALQKQISKAKEKK